MEWFYDLLKPELVWFVIGLVLLLAEFVSPGLVMFFFGAGAWIVALLCMIADVGLNMQLAVFAVSSVVLLVFLRRHLKGVFAGFVSSRSGENNEFHEDILGRRAVVVQEIPAVGEGKVEFHGTNWIAVSDVNVEKGETVEIVSLDNITLKVRPLRDSEESNQ